MADLSDLETALVNQIATILYPSGVSGKAAVSPVAGAVVDIRRGWPVPAVLDAAVKAGQVLVTVFSESGHTRNTTRFPSDWNMGTQPAATLTATVAGSKVTFGGTGGAGQVAGVGFGTTHLTSAYSYRLGASDSPASVAAAFAAAIPSATASGVVLTLATNQTVVANVVTDTPANRELRRQDQGVRITVWTGTPTLRDIVASAIDLGLAELSDVYGNLTYFLPLADGTGAKLRYRTTYAEDTAERANVYRRDLCYMAEYPTMQLVTFPALLWQGLKITVPPQGGVVIDVGQLQPNGSGGFITP